jgi:hypothetical protein
MSFRLLAPVLAALLPLPTQDELETFEYQGWKNASFEDWVIYTLDRGIGRPSSQITNSLRSITPDRVVIRVTSVTSRPNDFDKVNVIQTIIPAREKRGDSWFHDSEEISRGEETLAIGGGSLKTSWSERKLRNGIIRKVWLCDNIPGHIAKMTTSNPVDPLAITTLQAARWRIPLPTTPSPKSAEVKALNEAASQKLKLGADLVIDSKRLPIALASLSSAFQVPFFCDTGAIPGRGYKKISAKFEKGIPGDRKLTEVLEAYNLTWTLFQGAVVVTIPRVTKQFENGDSIGGPSDRELKNDQTVWTALSKPIELDAQLSIQEALLKVAHEAGIGIPERSWVILNDSDKIGWSAKRSALTHLRILCRTVMVEFEVRGGKLLVFSEPEGMGRHTDYVAAYDEVRNARAALYENHEEVYAKHLPLLLANRVYAKENAEGLLEYDLELKDQKGAAALRRILDDIK